MARQLALISAILALSLALAHLGGCKSKNETKPRPADLALQDTPSVLRGTIGVEAVFRGSEPALVSGLGLVVGLNGTGGGPLPDRVAGTMEREMALNGITKSLDAPGTPLDRKSPRDLLRDPSVAVVLVQAAIPPAAPEGTRFDVYVEALNATSLEGGLLWRVDLRLGEASVFGAIQAHRIAQARGPVFINPFAEVEGKAFEVGLTRGRILNGGVVTNPMRVELVMDELSHARSAMIVSAINSRLPMGPGDEGPTAAGRQTAGRDTGPAIALRVPQRFRDNSREFINIVKHITVDDSYPEQSARRYVEALKQDPTIAEDLSWCLEAIGPKALPFVRELYDYAEPVPRMAALRAGARLGDERAAKHLRDLAVSGGGTQRLEAIGLLARIDGGPTIDVTLRSLLSEKELITRVAAYEALARRAERLQIARFDAYRSANPDSELRQLSPTHVAELAKAELPPGTMQGVERRAVHDKFILDRVPEGDPLIYITQQGAPKIVIFGRSPSISRPAIASAWSDRLMLKSEIGEDTVRVRYQASEVTPAIEHELGHDLLDFVDFLTRKSGPVDPRPGLDMSYSQVVGVLYALSAANATDSGFATERDRMKALILEANAERTPRDYPETAKEADRVLILKRPTVLGGQPAEEPRVQRTPTIVPLKPPASK